MLPIAAIMAAAVLTGILVTAPVLVYADDTETSTDQSVKQKNVGSGDSLNFNCDQNLIKAGVGEQVCGQEDPGIIVCSVCIMGALQPNPLFGQGQ
ncbi:MAG: hypothetical protein WBL49_08430 [Nitrososphaeraceae archaeon]|jgi:hypothetical protein